MKDSSLPDEARGLQPRRVIRRIDEHKPVRMGSTDRPGGADGLKPDRRRKVIGEAATEMKVCEHRHPSIRVCLLDRSRRAPDVLAGHRGYAPRGRREDARAACENHAEVL